MATRRIRFDEEKNPFRPPANRLAAKVEEMVGLNERLVWGSSKFQAMTDIGSLREIPLLAEGSDSCPAGFRIEPLRPDWLKVGDGVV